jgi:hypothetical protein
VWFAAIGAIALVIAVLIFLALRRRGPAKKKRRSGR